MRRFESYPRSEDDPTVPPGPARVVGDVILEYRPDGTVVNRWPVLDLLDPYRIGYESLDWGFWQAVYEHVPEEPLCDWAHVNSVDYDARDHALIVSSYHQDSVFKLDLATGKRTLVREVTPADPTGVTRISTLQLTPDGRAYCYSFMRSLSRLYMVDGLR